LGPFVFLLLPSPLVAGQRFGNFGGLATEFFGARLAVALGI